MSSHRLLASLVLVCSLCVVASAAAQSSPALELAKIDPWLQHALGQDGRASFLVRFDTSEGFRERVALIARAADPRRAVYGALSTRARVSQARVRQWLDARGIRYRPLYIVNALSVEGDLALARVLAAFPEVGRIVGDPKVHGVQARLDASSSALTGAEWGVAGLGAGGTTDGS